MTIEHLLASVKKTGQRMTPAKIQLLTILHQATYPITAQEILVKMDINKTTIYRAIDTLIASGIVTEIDFGEGKKRYEVAHTTHHHHLICIKCHSIADYALDGDLKNQEQIIEKKNNFKVIRHSLEFFGLCRHCTTL